MPRSPTVLDLFAGTGGLSLGFHNAGYTTRYAIDHDSDAVESLEANFSHLGTKAMLQDLGAFSPIHLRNHLKRNGESTDFDVVVGGPPCQGWSKVGRGKLRSLAENSGRSYSGKDPRNEMFYVFLDFVKSFSPKVAVMENVPGMLSHKGKNVAETVEEEFDRRGYNVNWRLLNAKDFGVPQSRERLIFVGVRKDLKIMFEFPNPIKRDGSNKHSVVTVKEAIGDLPVIRSGSQEWIRKYSPRDDLSEFAQKMRSGADPEVVFDHVCRAHNDQDIEAFKFMKQGDWYRDLPKRFQRYRTDIFEDKYKKLYWNRPSWTVTAHLSKDCYTHIHPSQARTISIREAARLQSFPDCFYLAGNMGTKFRLVGNAVPPILAEKIAKEIKRQIFSSRRKGLTRNRKQVSARI